MIQDSVILRNISFTQVTFGSFLVGSSEILKLKELFDRQTDERTRCGPSFDNLH